MKISKFIVLFLCIIAGGCRKIQQEGISTLRVHTENTDIQAFQVIQLVNGSYVAACIEDNSSKSLVFAVNERGDKLWQIVKDYNSSTNTGDGELCCMAATPDGCFVAMFGNSIYKYGADGGLIWRKTDWLDSINILKPNAYAYPGNARICAGKDGYLYVISDVSYVDIIFPRGVTAYWVSRLDQSGNVLRTQELAEYPRQMKGYSADSVAFVSFRVLTTDDGIYAIGQRTYNSVVNYGMYSDYYCMKIGYDMAMPWVNIPNNPDNSLAIAQVVVPSEAREINEAPGNTMAILIDSDLNGFTQFFGFVGSAVFLYSGILALKVVDKNTGSVINSVILSHPGINMFPAMAPTADGGHIIAFGGDYSVGYFGNNFDGFYTPTDIILVKEDGNLNQQWMHTIKPTNPSTPFGVVQTSDGGYLIFTTMRSSIGNYCDLAIFKTDPAGNFGT